jgi:hypothetical protein
MLISHNSFKLTPEQLTAYRKLNQTRIISHSQKLFNESISYNSKATFENSYVTLASLLNIQDPDERDEIPSGFLKRMIRNLTNLPSKISEMFMNFIIYKD